MLIVGQEFVPHIEKVEDDLETVTTIVAIGGHARWARLRRRSSAGHEPTIPASKATGSDVAFQLYTSGTTGLPKGVMLTNDNFFSGVMNVTSVVAVHAGLGESSPSMPMFHIAGSGWSMVGLLSRLPHGPAARCRPGAHPSS